MSEVINSTQPDTKKEAIEEDYVDITSDSLDLCIEEKIQLERWDMESTFSYLNPFFLLTGWLLVLVFIIQVQQGLFSLGNEIDLSNFTYQFSNYRAGGNYWGMITSIFLHGSVEHLLGNMVFLYIFGLVSYRLIGFIQSIFVFLATGFLAGVTSFYLGDVPGIGASGAVFGMFGFLSVFYIIHQKNLSVNLQDLSWVMLISAILQIASGFTVSYIDNNAHLGGFISGCIIGYFYFRSHPNILSK